MPQAPVPKHAARKAGAESSPLRSSPPGALPTRAHAITNSQHGTLVRMRRLAWSPVAAGEAGGRASHRRGHAVLADIDPAGAQAAVGRLHGADEHLGAGLQQRLVAG